MSFTGDKEEEEDIELPQARPLGQVEVATGRTRTSSQNSVTYIKGLSRSVNEVNLDSEGYTPLQLSSTLSLPTASAGSSTEASSFSSANSSRGLLPQGMEPVSDDDEKLWQIQNGEGEHEGQALIGGERRQSWDIEEEEFDQFIGTEDKFVVS